MRSLVVAFLLLIAATAGAAYWHLRAEHVALARQLRAAQARTVDTIRLQEENKRLNATIQLSTRDRAAAQRALQVEAEQARRDVAALENRAREQFRLKRAHDAAAEEALRTNRDLRKGLVLLENLGNVGQSSPVDALQTLVWASANGRDEVVANRIAISDGARAVAEALIATLPEATRSKFPTPEALTALYVADQINDASAIQVLGENPVDALHVVLKVGKLSGRAEDVPMRLGPDGWQVDLSTAKVFTKIKTQLLKPPK